MYHYVYEIRNKVNGRKYIGKRSSEKEPQKDWYMGSGFALKKAKEKVPNWVINIESTYFYYQIWSLT